MISQWYMLTANKELPAVPSCYRMFNAPGKCSSLSYKEVTNLDWCKEALGCLGRCLRIQVASLKRTSNICCRCLVHVILGPGDHDYSLEGDFRQKQASTSNS